MEVSRQHDAKKYSVASMLHSHTIISIVKTILQTSFNVFVDDIVTTILY